MRAVVFKDADVRGQVFVNASQRRIDVAACESAPRRRFIVAHELGHAVLHLIGKHQGGYVDTCTHIRTGGLEPAFPDEEADANRFAGALLMPRTWVQLACQHDAEPASLARTFNVSVDAIVHRLRALERRAVGEVGFLRTGIRHDGAGPLPTG
jgi:Zn-dependent peptidase ImmA (M78 family)